jgi:hypothetical protein
MHNSEGGLPVAIVDGAVSADPIQNLLRLDCIACHANNPTGGTKLWTMSGGSVVPQVMHGSSDDLAGGNFQFGGSGNTGKVHNVVDLFNQLGGVWEDNAGDPADTAEFGAPPGTAPAAHYHGYSRSVFTVNFSTPFDAFTCAGARGCHGTRSQLLSGTTTDNGTANVYTGVRRTGMAAISGAHHNNYDGDKSLAENYVQGDAVHDGQRVADGYRFIPGLKGWGNETTRWENVSSAEHNEYYGSTAAFGSGCGTCHTTDSAGTGGNFGYNSRAALGSTLKVPGNSMSGFCATCHGKFHSAGAGTDYVDNGVSGAFLRHPSDYIIPDMTEYSAYTAYDLSAPVARQTLAASSATVTPGTDMVMCLSCHEAHGSAYDYILRFDYATMEAGGFGSISAAQGAGGCLACHTTKGVLPSLR